MTDSPDSHDSGDSPEIEEVRRLLADARHAEPMPDDVVARMDDVIAGLREDPAESSDRGDVVVPLSRHRRRRAAGLLVAAAAIVVGGVAVAQNLPTSSSSSTTSAGSDAAAQDSGTSPPHPRRSPGAESFAARGKDSRLKDGVTVLDGGALVVHPRRFSADALAGRKLLAEHGPNVPSASQFQLDLSACASVPTEHGVVLRATYQKAPAALVYRRASGGSQVVDLYVCGSPSPVRSATLPAP